LQKIAPFAASIYAALSMTAITAHDDAADNRSFTALSYRFMKERGKAAGNTRS
jgi:hypothetical protein